jgi:hypothetical protein
MSKNKCGWVDYECFRNRVGVKIGARVKIEEEVEGEIWIDTV